MREAQRIAAGTRWIGEAFERLRGASRRTVPIVAWDWQEEDPEYRIRIHLAGHAAPLSIPSQGLGFGRGQLVVCGEPAPENESARHEVETILVERLAGLAAAQSFPSRPTPPVLP
jgi:hypothetical protein